MDDATQVLLKLLRTHFEQSAELGEAWKDAPRVVLLHLSRPGWPAEFLDKDRKGLIHIELQKIAKELFYANDMKSLLKFAQQAVGLVLQYSPRRSDEWLQKQQLKQFIQMEQLEGRRDKTAALRGAVRYLNGKKRETAGKFYVPADPDNRLLELLSLPKSLGAQLPKEDIRGLILKNSLADLLKQVSCFSPDIIKSALGEDLSRKLTVVGFFDRAKQTLLVKVKSAAMAHEMSFQKPEILRRLNQIKEFEGVTDIRFSTAY